METRWHPTLERQVPVVDTGLCDECGSTIKGFDMSDHEPVYPCTNCGEATCGSIHTQTKTSRDGDGGYWVDERLCPSCVQGRAYVNTVEHDYRQ